MKKSEAIEKTRQACRLRRFSLKSERSYCGWVDRFCRWCSGQGDALPMGDNAIRVSAYLSELAPRSAAATQRQALNALVFFYQEREGEQQHAN